MTSKAKVIMKLKFSLLVSESKHKEQELLAISRDCSKLLKVLQEGSDLSMDDAGWPKREDVLRLRRKNKSILNASTAPLMHKYIYL